MYAKCGALEKAQEVFDELAIRNEVSWNALISGYAQHGQGDEALECFQQMQTAGCSPNAFTLACTLKACGSMGDVGKGEEIHNQIKGDHLLNEDIVVAGALVDMYAKCGALKRAQEVFDELPFQDKVLWTALIAGYVQHGQNEEALGCFEKMRLAGFSPDAVTFMCILKACGDLGASDKGEEVYSEIVKSCLDHNVNVLTALVDMYAKCGAVQKALEVFDGISMRNVVSWNVLIAGYSQHEDGEVALNLGRRMQLEGLCPTSVTFACTLKACGSLQSTEKGQELHAQIISGGGLHETGTMVGNALVDMYAKCGALGKAREVFDMLPIQDVVSWTSLISAHVQQQQAEEALSCFKQMQQGGLAPDPVTYSCILKACGSLRSLSKGEEIHAQIIKEGLLERHSIVLDGLIDMYARCCALRRVAQLISELDIWTSFAWNAVIAGYAQHDQGEEALNFFKEMQRENISLDGVTCSSILKACGSAGATYTGQIVHAEIVRYGFLKMGVVGGSEVVGIYANSGMLEEAQYSFDKLPARDVIVWNALMLGYAQLGQDQQVILRLVDQMTGEGIEPNSATFTILLTAYAHTGLLDEGQMYFRIVSNGGYGIIQNLEHFTCLVDLFSRAGLLETALAVMEEMPFCPDFTVWHTLLGACQKWKNFMLGRWAFEHAVQVDSKSAAIYVCMSNVLVGACREEYASYQGG